MGKSNVKEVLPNVFFHMHVELEFKSLYLKGLNSFYLDQYILMKKFILNHTSLAYKNNNNNNKLY